MLAHLRQQRPNRMPENMLADARDTDRLKRGANLPFQDRREIKRSLPTEETRREYKIRAARYEPT